MNSCELIEQDELNEYEMRPKRKVSNSPVDQHAFITWDSVPGRGPCYGMIEYIEGSVVRNASEIKLYLRGHLGFYAVKKGG